MYNDEQDIIASAINGDAEAFGVLVSRYTPKALAYARQMAGNSDDAKDLVQESFVKAYYNLGSFKGESGFPAWFFRVLTNICMDHLRKRALVKKVFFFLPGPDGSDDEGEEDDGPLYTAADLHPLADPGGVLEQKELNRAFGKALKVLPARQRAAFVLRHGDGMKLSEVAAALGITEGAVKAHLVRAVASVQKSMKEYGYHG